MDSIDILIIGGGASGYFCANQLLILNPKLKVQIWEKSNKTLSKVRISGGGRCNVTHDQFENRFLIKKYPRGQKYLKNKFNLFNVKNTFEWFEKLDIQLKIESDGRVFPVSNSSETIASALENHFSESGGILKLNTTIQSFKKVDEEFLVIDNHQNVLNTKFLVFALGGLTITQSEWLKKSFPISITALIPSIFTFNIQDKTLHELAGVSVPQGKVKFEGISQEYFGPVLITHWGLSGPAVLAASAWHAVDLKLRNYKINLLVSWVAEKNEDLVRNSLISSIKSNPHKIMANINYFDLPRRLWLWILKKSQIQEDTNGAHLKRDEINRLVENILRTKFEINGKTTFKEEFVTAGGIELEELNKDGSFKKDDRVYFVGEMLDVDGVTGGFNFQAAWSTGYVAAQSIHHKFLQRSN